MINRSKDRSTNKMNELLWSDDKFGFKIAYAIKLKGFNWKIKKPGHAWEGRSTDWDVKKEQHWRKQGLFYLILR